MRMLFVFLSFATASFAAPPSDIYPVAILGGGVGALTSSLYISRAGIQPLLIEGKQPGGLITQSHMVQNWPGEMEIKGSDLAHKLRKQAEENGALFLSEEVVRVDFSTRPFKIFTRPIGQPDKEKQIRAKTVIIAMGTQPNHLGVKGEKGADGYWGRGVTNCAVCDGALYRDQIVGVVGGGDAALLESLYLANIAKEVHVFVRKQAFKVVEEKRLQELFSRPNIKVHFGTTVEEILGNGEQVTGVLLKTEKKGARPFPLDGLFLAIGSTPNTKIFQNVLELDKRGYIALKKDQETSVPGVYAIGDIVDPVYKQAISAAGDGAKAAMQSQMHLDALGRERAAFQMAVKKGAAHKVIEVASAEEFNKELQSSLVPVVVDFYAVWCGPCKQVAPLLDRSAESLSGHCKFLKVDVEKVQELTKLYRIRSMPTVLVFNPEGKVVEREVGTDQIAGLLQRLETSFY